MSGGGSKQPKHTTQDVTTTTIPKELMPYAMGTLGQASALTDINQNPYQQYQGQRLAELSPLQLQAMRGVQQMQPSAQLQQATGMAGLAGLGALNAGRFDQNEADFYMSPYMQSVVDVQQRKAREASNIAGVQRGANAATSGAFTGNRAALQQSMADRELGYQLGDIQAQGQQSAWDQAQRQYNADAQRRMQGYQTAVGAAGAMGDLGQNSYLQQMGIYDAQQKAGKELQDQEQQGLTMSYQDFLNQQQYPYQQLAFMNSLIHGTQATDQMKNMYQDPGNQNAQIAGLAGGLGSLFMGSKG